MTEHHVDLGHGYTVRIKYDSTDSTCSLFLGTAKDGIDWIKQPRPWYDKFLGIPALIWWPLDRLPEAMALAIQRVAAERAKIKDFAEQCDAATAEAMEVVKVWNELEGT